MLLKMIFESLDREIVQASISGQLLSYDKSDIRKAWEIALAKALRRRAIVDCAHSIEAYRERLRGKDPAERAKSIIVLADFSCTEAIPDLEAFLSDCSIAEFKNDTIYGEVDSTAGWDQEDAKAFFRIIAFLSATDIPGYTAHGWHSVEVRELAKWAVARLRSYGPNRGLGGVSA